MKTELEIIEATISELYTQLQVSAKTIIFQKYRMKGQESENEIIYTNPLLIIEVINELKKLKADLTA